MQVATTWLILTVLWKRLTASQQGIRTQLSCYCLAKTTINWPTVQCVGLSRTAAAAHIETHLAAWAAAVGAVDGDVADNDDAVVVVTESVQAVTETVTNVLWTAARRSALASSSCWSTAVRRRSSCVAVVASTTQRCRRRPFQRHLCRQTPIYAAVPPTATSLSPRMRARRSRHVTASATSVADAVDVDGYRRLSSRRWRCDVNATSVGCDSTTIPCWFLRCRPTRCGTTPRATAGGRRDAAGDDFRRRPSWASDRRDTRPRRPSTPFGHDTTSCGPAAPLLWEADPSVTSPSWSWRSHLRHRRRRRRRLPCVDDDYKWLSSVADPDKAIYIIKNMTHQNQLELIALMAETIWPH